MQMPIKETQALEEQGYIRAQLFDAQKSNFQKYRDLVIGEASFWEFFKYELITTLFGSVPGALGLFLRKVFYPRLFKDIGKNVVFGRNIVIRHPKNIKIGNRVVIDDYSIIDARGAGKDGVFIGDDTIINRNASIQAKLGSIYIGAGTDVGMYSVIHSQGGVRIGKMVTLGGECKISGGMFQIERTIEQNEADSNNINSFSSREQTRYTKGPIVVGDKCILGIGVIILDGANIGEGCVIGAGSVVIKDIPGSSVAAGSPAKVIRSREGTQS